MADVFISYSRRDREFVHRLNDALSRAGHDAWVDWEDIPPTAEWMEEINSAIDSADTFVFALSPSSIQSQVCRKEIDHAVAQNKRLVPIVCTDVDPDGVPESLVKLEWVFFRDADDFEKSFGLLITALETDIDRARIHTRLLVRAREWTRHERDKSYLLRGSDLGRAEEWLATRSTGGPVSTEEQAQYVVASRRAATTRQRIVLASVAAGLVIAVVLALVALGQRNQAVAARSAEQKQREVAVVRQKDAEVARDEARTQQQAAEFARKLEVLSRREAEQARMLAEKRRLEAEYERNVAVYQRGLAESGQRSAMFRQLLVSSEREQERYPSLAALLALEALKLWDDDETRELLFQALTRVPGRRQMTLPAEHVRSAAWAPDGKTLLIRTTSTAGVWELSGKRKVTFYDTGSFSHATWSPKGDRVLTVSGHNRARVWDLSGRVLFELTGHRDRITNSKWSPDGEQLLTVSADGTGRIWPAMPLREFASRHLSRDFTAQERKKYLELEEVPRELEVIASTGQDRRGAFNPVGRWRVRSRVPDGGRVDVYQLHPDHRFALERPGDELFWGRWEYSAGRKILTLKIGGGAMVLRISHEGEDYFAATDRQGKVFDLVRQ